MIIIICSTFQAILASVLVPVERIITKNIPKRQHIHQQHNKGVHGKVWWHASPLNIEGFPRDPQRRKRWEIQVRRHDWSPSPHSLLCSDHIFEKDIDRSGDVVKIKKDAEPRRFKQFPDYLKTVSKARRELKRKSCDKENVEVPEAKKIKPDQMLARLLFSLTINIAFSHPNP
eukprot:gene10339-11414_t